jgi:hypothetical protein
MCIIRYSSFENITFMNAHDVYVEVKAGSLMMILNLVCRFNCTLWERFEKGNE